MASDEPRELQVRKGYALIQEGGSTTELYLHSHGSLEEANLDRESCADGAYRTTEPVEHSIVTIDGRDYMTLDGAYALCDKLLDGLSDFS